MMNNNSTVNTRPSRPAREKAHKSNPDHNKSTDGTPLKIQPTAEQIRLAQMINDTKDMDDPELQSKIKQVMELTGRSSDEASVALHDCDNDPNRAIDMLLEGQTDQGEWETSMKRKKNRPTTTSTVEILPTPPTVNNKENKPRTERTKDKPGKERDNRNRMPPRMSRGKGRDSEKNEKNLEDGQQFEQQFERRGRGARMMNGPGRGGRGRGGGRIRTFQSRGSSNLDFPRSIETWTNASADDNSKEEDRLRVGNWSDGFPPTEEWDNEDWTGSLAETKVFTPSSNIVSGDYAGPSNKHQSSSGNVEVSSLGLGLDVTNVTQQSASLDTSKFDQNNLKTINYSQPSVDVGSTSVNQSLNFNLSVTGTSDISSFSIPSSQTTPMANVHEANLCSSPLSMTSLAVSGGSTRNPSLSISSGNHSSQMVIPPRPKSQRPRGLGTSKIPATAVEMPDDAITTLDVQFGSLEFGIESPKLNLSSLLDGTSIQSTTDRNSTLSNHLNLTTSSTNNSQVLSSSNSASNSLHMPSLVKSSADLDNLEQNSRIPYTSSVTTLSASKDLSSGTVSQTNSSQVLSGSDMMSLANVSDRKSSYSLQRSSRPSALDGSVVNTKPSDSLSTFSVPSYQVNYGSSKNSTSSSYPNSHSTLTSSSSSQAQNMSSLYGSSLSPAVVSLQSVTPTSAYGSSQVQPLTYQSYASPANTSAQMVSGVINSQSAYGHSSLNMSMSGTKLTSNLSNSTVKDVSDSASQHLYDSNNLTSALTTSSVASTLGLSGTSFTSANSTSGKSPSAKNFDQGKAGLATLPPGVPAVLSHPYIMGQAGVPFYSLPQPVYSYEDLQILQQRMAPMSSFYDMSFQPSNSMTARDTGGLSNMAYSGTDGKFSRGDSSSPVPTSSLPQQSTTQQHQQTFISPTALPPGYGYYYSGGVVAGGFAQYGPQIFPVATATNTHGATSSTHFQKPNAYSSHGYTSTGYDSLGQNQDYSKATYGSGTQNQSKAVSGAHMSLQNALGTVNSMSTNDMSGSVYSKGHAQMNKSFDKPGFHAGTPPPFNSQTAAALGGPSTAYTAPTFISMMAHNPSPQMLHHQMHQDSTSASQRPNVNPAQNKSSSTSKQSYGGSSYWTST